MYYIKMYLFINNILVEGLVYKFSIVRAIIYKTYNRNKDLFEDKKGGGLYQWVIFLYEVKIFIDILFRGKTILNLYVDGRVFVDTIYCISVRIYIWLQLEKSIKLLTTR